MTSPEHHVAGQHESHDNRTPEREASDARVQLREEELAARKRAVETGRVSVGTEVVEEKQTLEVPVTREEVVVERRPVDRRPSDEPIEGTSSVVQVPVHEEHVTLDKQSVVYEEVNVGKRAVEQTQRVSDTVRKEVVDVDATGNVGITPEADDRR